MKKIISVFIFISLVFIYVYFFRNSTKNYNSNKSNIQEIHIAGASSMQEISEFLAKSLMNKHKNLKIIKASTGSADAPLAVKSNSADIGDISKNFSEDEINEILQQFNIHIIAYDGIAICLNKKLKINNLSLYNLRKIFAGKIKNWKTIGGPDTKIIVVGRDEASGTRQTFENILNLKDQCNYSVILENNGKVKFKLQNDENAIGYLSFSAVDKTINAVNIDEVSPSLDNLKSKKYPFIQPLMQITNKKLVNETVELWFKFVFSKEGREIIEANKLLPV